MEKKLFASAASLLCALGASAAQPDFSAGVFIVNEDWYGHQNSTVNYFNHNATEGEVWQYRVVQEQNPGRQLGCTNQYGQIYGGRFYLIAKQEKDPGASVTGGRISVCDASTMKLLFQTELIDPSGAQCDGRGCLGVDEHKVYVSSSNGIWILDTDSYTIKGQVEGSANPNGADGKPGTDPSGSLYHGQCGSMVRVNDRVFAAHQAFGLLVIDPETDKVTDVVTMDEVTSRVLAETSIKTNQCGIGSVILAKDGSLWVSCTKNIQGDGTTVPYMMRVDPATLATEIIPIPADIYPPATSWYAWTPDGFCASALHNSLYWNGGPNSWFSNTKIYRYDIDSGEFSCVIDLDREAIDQHLTEYTRWKLYGCSMRVHPVTDELYLSLFHYFQSPVYKLRRTDRDGVTLAEYDMIQNYWFPSLPVFPDIADPVTSDLGTIDVSVTSATMIDLAGWATDADNMDSAIVKRVEEVSDPGMFSARIVNGALEIIPLAGATGEGWVRIKVNSNGRVISSVIRIRFGASGIDGPVSENIGVSFHDGVLSVSGAEGKEISLYSADGRLVGAFRTETDRFRRSLTLTPGIYIVRTGNFARKIIVR